MAIYERAYRGYAGPVTPTWSRFLVLPRYAFETVFASKMFTSFFALCFVPSLVGAVLVYLHHNLKALTILNMTPDQLLPIDARFFLWLLTISALMLGFLLTLLVGPGLISRDLLHDEPRRVTLAKAGFDRAKEFTWASSAEVHVATWNRVAG